MANAYLGGHGLDLASGGAGIRVGYDQAGSVKHGGAALNHADDRERLLKALDENVRLLRAALPPLDDHRGSFPAFLSYLRSIERFQVKKPKKKKIDLDTTPLSEIFFSEEVVWSRSVVREQGYISQIETILQRLERLGFELNRISLA